MKKLAIVLLVLAVLVPGFLLIHNRASLGSASGQTSGSTDGTLFTDGGFTWKLGAFTSNGTNVPMSNITVRAMQRLPSETLPAGSIHLDGTDLALVLKVYGSLAQAQVDTSQLVTPLLSTPIHFINTNAVTRSEAIRLLDRALYDQAGIVATHPDKTHVVFTHSP